MGVQENYMISCLGGKFEHTFSSMLDESIQFIVSSTLFSICFLLPDTFSAFRSPRHQGGNLKKGRCNLGGRGSGQGIIKQTGHTLTPWAWWDAPSTSAGGAVKCHCKATLDNLWMTMVTRRSVWGLPESKYHSSLQEGQEGVLRELQPRLNPFEGDGIANPGNNFQAYKGQESHEE